MRLRGILFLVLVLGTTLSFATCDTTPYRTINGTLNNPLHPNWGVAFGVLDEGVPEGVFHRTEQADFSDVSQRLSPRDNVVNPGIAGSTLLRHPSMTSPRYFADQNLLFIYLSQFLTHDMASTGTLPINTVNPSDLKEAVLAPDDILLLGPASIDVIDSLGIPQAVNNATAFIDLSAVYGSTDTISRALRTLSGGLLKTAQRRQMNYVYKNDPSFDLCNCVDTITGQPYNVYAPDGSNFRQIRSQNAAAFTPEPQVLLGINSTICATVGFNFLFSCAGGVPAPKPHIVCTVNFTALNDPRRAPLAWEIPANEEWMPFVAETNPPVPFDTVGQTSNTSKIFAAGDIRNLENYGILNVHHIFLREHNRYARLLATANPTWDDEKLFQEARKWNIAVWQHIVVDELTQIMVGKKAFKKSYLNEKYKDTDYNPQLDPRTGNLFSSAAMRWGHSMTPHRLFPYNYRTNSRIISQREQLFAHQSGVNNPGTSPYIFTHQGGQINAFAAADDYMAWLGGQLPSNVKPDHALLMATIKQKAQRLDRYVEDSLARIEISSCFVPNRSISIPSFTIFRGRTHGLPDYNTLRQMYTQDNLYCAKKCLKFPNGTDSLDCFVELAGKNEVEFAKALADIYGSVDNIDPFVGFILEAQTYTEGDALLGKTAAAVVLEQIERSRKSDRFWYENSINGFTTQELKTIEKTTFKDLVARSYPDLASYLPKDIFKGTETYF